MLRVAVVGATGRIGRPLCRELIKAGHVVTVISRDPARAAAVVRGADGYVAAIEDAARAAGSHGARTVLLRTGYVLTGDSLAGQATQFRHHFGGWIGSGRGWTPWIHIADETGIIRFARRRAWLPVPSPLVRMGLGVITDILVRGKRVLPAKAASAGYQFRFPEVEAALRDLVAERGADR
jgi:NAD dependent epimerase/dehydratase family enzyme